MFSASLKKKHCGQCHVLFHVLCAEQGLQRSNFVWRGNWAIVPTESPPIHQEASQAHGSRAVYGAGNNLPDANEFVTLQDSPKTQTRFVDAHGSASRH